MSACLLTRQHVYRLVNQKAFTFGGLQDGLSILLAKSLIFRYSKIMTIIVVANSKGGVGKSTLAVHLAAWLDKQGHRVTLADCDAQMSSSEWIKEAAPQIKVERLESPDEIIEELPLLDQEADYVVADGPGSNTDTSRALLCRADMAIVPCKASMLEVRALAIATRVVKQAQSVRGGPPKAVIVLNMVGKNYRLTTDMQEAASALHFPLAKQPMILRQIYADAPGQGAVVWNMGSRAREASEEVQRLFSEILPDAVASKKIKREARKR